MRSWLNDDQKGETDQKDQEDGEKVSEGKGHV